ncbi:hypothetical protein C4D60_Mb07t23890 [Musa balbisiana]|uniref:Uncharacterized protein n=1 Tax=Musa balbisiana TaxID=52838 RepID=A0A4S8JHK2_MUSBA|nr:hypothetical protein C4D60_Mb07t23890 [Musa balbisiana]
MDSMDANSWQEMMRKILPPGTPIPEAPANLDYSIAIEYDGPPVSYELPRVDPVDLIPTAEPALSRRRLRKMDSMDANSWQEMMRKILPPGTPIPEAPANLDYSIAIEYDGPPVSYELPRVDPVDLIPTAEPALSRRRSASGTLSPVLDPIPLPVSRIAHCADHPSRSPQDSGSSESVDSVLQNEEFSDASHSVSPVSAHSLPNEQPSQLDNEERRASVVTFEEKSENKKLYHDFSGSPQYVGVTRKDKRKKVCYRCGKRKWESKEVCLVCDKREVRSFMFGF